MENKKTKREIAESLNKKIAEEIANRRKSDQERKKAGIIKYYISLHYDSVIFSPVGGYTIKELENNKPLTLLKAKENRADFVAFVNVRSFSDGGDWFTFFDINEDKKTIDFCGALPHMGYALKDARKDAGRVFMVLNKNIDQYYNATRKHFERTKKMFLELGDRWTLSAFDVERFDRLHYDKRHQWHRLAAGELDKSGYYLPLFRGRLADRVAEVKRQKAAKAEEQRRAEFIASDKSDILQVIKASQTHNKIAILKLLDYEKIMTRGAVSLLKQLKNNIIDLQKIADDVNKYARYNDPQKEIENDILKIKESYLVAITQYNESGRDWCGVGCYTIKNGEVVARYNWIGQPNTCHAGEVVRCAVNLSGF